MQTPARDRLALDDQIVTNSCYEGILVRPMQVGVSLTVMSLDHF